MGLRFESELVAGTGWCLLLAGPFRFVFISSAAMATAGNTGPVLMFLLGGAALKSTLSEAPLCRGLLALFLEPVPPQI